MQPSTGNWNGSQPTDEQPASTKCQPTLARLKPARPGLQPCNFCLIEHTQTPPTAEAGLHTLLLPPCRSANKQRGTTTTANCCQHKPASRLHCLAAELQVHAPNHCRQCCRQIGNQATKLQQHQAACGSPQQATLDQKSPQSASPTRQKGVSSTEYPKACK